MGVQFLMKDQLPDLIMCGINRRPGAPVAMSLFLG